jgi:hypothetical protein
VQLFAAIDPGAGRTYARSTRTCGRLDPGTESTFTTRGLQHTAQSSTTVWCSPPPASIATGSTCPQNGHATSTDSVRALSFGFLAFFVGFMGLTSSERLGFRSDSKNKRDAQCRAISPLSRVDFIMQAHDRERVEGHGRDDGTHDEKD